MNLLKIDKEVRALIGLAETYQNEWFDRIMGLSSGLLKAREGPQKLQVKRQLTEILEKALEEGIDIDRNCDSILANDNVFKFAYKGNTNPLTVFKPVTDRIKAAKGDIDAEAGYSQAMNDLMENFAAGAAGQPGFDEFANELDKENF